MASKSDSKCWLRSRCFGTGHSSTQASPRPTGVSLGSRLAISGDQVHRAIGRGQNCAICRQCGVSNDNAQAETINGLFKAEIIHRHSPWRSFEAVEYATLEWVDWFNIRRLLEPIGNIPPVEAEANFYAAMDRSDMAA